MALENLVLQRADEAARKRDWPLAYKLLCICSRGNRLGRNQIGDDAAGIADYLAAQRFEKAEQWPEAMRGYQNVLRRMGERSPVAEATERLRILKKEHPEISAAPVPAQPADVVR